MPAGRETATATKASCGRHLMSIYHAALAGLTGLDGPADEMAPEIHPEICPWGEVHRHELRGQ